MKNNKRLAIVVPCYNEEEALVDTDVVLNNLIKDLIKKKLISANSYILYVNDGSSDNTWEVIKNAHKKSKYVKGLCLAGNKGHQNALYAGLMQVKDEVAMSVSIDADLQDDVKVIEEMIKKYYEGNDIVYGVRNDRNSDTGFKKNSAELFYKLMNKLGAKTVYNSADFRLMSSRALNELALYEESHLFLRGIVPELGFKTDVVYYKRNPRLKGESKYPLKKMIAFAIDGITSFSDKPLNLVIYLGLIAIFFAIIFVVYSLIRHASGHTIEGWTSIFISIWFIGGVQLVSLGVIGKYVGKTYIESKKRPRYYIAEYLDKSED